MAGASSRGPACAPADVDAVHLYDSFTITVLLLLEDLGFCKKGEGGPFVEDGKLRLGGALPLNTDGGGLSSLPPGHAGSCSCSSRRCASCAARRARPRSPTPRLALACGSGGWLSCMGAVVLGRE